MRDSLGKLPERVAMVFMTREMDEVESKEICYMLSISDSNLWVMLHRARRALRECLAMNWFETLVDRGRRPRQRQTWPRGVSAGVTPPATTSMPA